MPESTHSTETYWGSTITIRATPQPDGTWSATATVQVSGAAEAATTLQAASQPSAAAAMAAARALATGKVDRGRTGQGKP